MKYMTYTHYFCAYLEVVQIYYPVEQSDDQRDTVRPVGGLGYLAELEVLHKAV
jgi:hypothetical protein